MAATTEPKRESQHDPSGGAHRKRSHSWLIIGGAIFVLGWLAWTMFLSVPA